MNTPEAREFNLKALLVLSLGHFVTDIYQGALPAILPFLKERLALSYSTAGLLLLASNVTSSVIQPLFGLLSDRKGRPFLLPLGVLVAGGGFSLVALPTNVALIMLLVILSGLGVAAYHPEGFKTASYFTGTRAATGMAVFSVGGYFGFAIAPMIALSIVTRLGFSWLPLMMIFSLLFLAALAVLRSSIAVPEAVREHAAAAVRTSRRRIPVSLVVLIGTVIIRSWAHAGIMTYIPFYYIDYLKGDPLYAGQLVSVFLLGGVAGTIIGSPLADRWGHKRYLVLSMILSTLMFPFIFMVKGSLLVLALGLFGMVLISTFSVTVVMAQRLLPGNLGVASGLMVGFAIGTGGVGVTILGIIADHFGVPFALKSIMVLPLAGLALSLFIKYPSGR
ncbi:MAG: MFS transporter [Nitrospirota bacterium]